MLSKNNKDLQEKMTNIKFPTTTSEKQKERGKVTIELWYDLVNRHMANKVVYGGRKKGDGN